MFPSLRLLNHYQSLGVGFRASSAEIKTAFRALAKKYHPDQNGNDPTAETKFREIKEAYELLCDKARRLEYDREWVHTGRLKWVPKADATSESTESESTTLPRNQLIMLYAAVIGLPFLASLLRGDPKQPQQTDQRRTTAWNRAPPAPQASPRDELVRAFYNPLSRRWERLGELNDPPRPIDLFKHTVKQHPGVYMEILRTVCCHVSEPTQPLPRTVSPFHRKTKCSRSPRFQRDSPKIL